ncbi:UNVERIFIED_CONTAM: hypothetical protein Sindi_1652800 [Sesamum indicum]
MTLREVEQALVRWSDHRRSDLLTCHHMVAYEKARCLTNHFRPPSASSPLLSSHTSNSFPLILAFDIISRSRSGTDPISESASSSCSSSMLGSSATSPREVTSTSHDPVSLAPASSHSHIPEETADSDDVPIHQKYSDMMHQKPWLGIVNLILPRSFDRMHQPPEGCCALSILHLDAGLHFPLPREVNNILVRLDLCPMQLSPNSISHIHLFIIVMKHLDLPPTFDNFWSLYNIIASKMSGETGWFYLTTRKDCRYLDDLKSNVGPWRERYFFIRLPPSQSWNFGLICRESKPKPKTYGEGFESDLINYITLFWYLPKALLQEKVLKLTGLSPALIPIKGTLESEIMLARIANKARALKGTLPPLVDRELARATAAAKEKSKDGARSSAPPSATPTASDVPAPSPIQIDDPSPDTQVEVVEVSDERGTKTKRGKGKGKGKARTPEPTESKSKSGSEQSLKSGRQKRLEARMATYKANETENRQKLAAHKEVWQRTRDERSLPARTAEMSGEKWIPDWAISKNSSIMQTRAGQDSWDVYKTACLERDQIILAQISHTTIEEHIAHSITQTMAFAHNLSLQSSMWRHNKIEADTKVVEMEKKVLELKALVESLQADSKKVEELTKKLEESEKQFEEVMSSPQRDRKAAFKLSSCSKALKNVKARFRSSEGSWNASTWGSPPEKDNYPEFAPLMDELPPPSHT